MKLKLWIFLLFFLSVNATMGFGADIKTIELIPDKKAYKTTLGKDNDEVIIGDEKSAKFIPQIKFTKWDKENYLTIKHSKNNWFESPILEDGRIKLVNHIEELEIYNADENNLKFIITLKTKPIDNRFIFYLEGYEDFDFFYQPALTQKEINDGHIRPDDVVGSYAVYHKTKSHNKYTTGKAFHIYRPKWVDTKGDWVWADLEIKEGEYINTLPDDFWHNAVYPIYCNDTFGNTNLGGAEFPGAAGRLIWFELGQASSAGTVTGFYSAVTDANLDANEVMLGLYEYAVNGDKYDYTLAVQDALWDDTPEFNTVAKTAEVGYSISADTTYFGAVIHELHLSHSVYDIVSGWDAHIDATGAFLLPATLPNADVDYTTYKYSFYVEYTPEAPPPSGVAYPMILILE